MSERPRGAAPEVPLHGPGPRRPVVALAGGVAWALGAWASLGAVALTGQGTWLRAGILPPPWVLGALVAAAVAVIAALQIHHEETAPLWLALVAWLPWVPGPIPSAFLIFDGPIAIAVAAGVAALVVLRVVLSRAPAFRSAARHMLLAGVLSALLSIAAAWRMAPVLPGGDEPHYLILTQSLLTDGDLQIENNHERGDYRAYVEGELKPDYLRRGQNGQIYSIHAPGVAVLVLPAFALAGYPGVVIFLALLSAAGGVLVWRTAYRLTMRTDCAWVGWAAVVLTAPFFFQSFTVYPDGPAALLVLLVVSGLAEEGRWPRHPRDAWLAGVAIAALPWLHTRDAILSLSMALVIGARVMWPAGSGRASWRERLRTVVASAAPPLVSVVGWLWFFHAIYGQFDPRAPYGHATDEHLSRVPIGLTGLLFDQQFGLLPNAPVYAIALAGLVPLARQKRRFVVELLVIAVPYVLAVAGFTMWWAGHSSPARFLVPVLLPLALPLAWAWRGQSVRGFPGSANARIARTLTVAALTFSVALTLALAWVGRGALVYNVRDGYALWLDAAAPAVNLARAAPSLFQGGAFDAWARLWVWVLPALVAWRPMRSLAGVIRPRGVWTLVAGGVMVVLLLLGATLAWPGGDELEPGAAALRYAARACAQGISVGDLEIPDASRRPPMPERALWFGRDVPPGRYRLSLHTGLNTTGRLGIGVGRPDTFFSICTVQNATPSASACEVDLPAGAASLWVQGDTAARRTVSHVDLAVERPGAPGSCGLRAERAMAGGGQVVFVTAGRVSVNGAGGWVAGASYGDFVAAGAAVGLRLRNGAKANHIGITAGAWHDEWDARPGETRDIQLPLPAEGQLQRFTVSSADGFRPIDFAKDSRDARYLGVWVELR